MARGLDGDGVRVNDVCFVEKFRYDDIRVLFVVQCPVLASPRLICDDIICGRTRGPSQSYHLQLFDPESRIGCRPWNEAIICLFFHCMLADNDFNYPRLPHDVRKDGRHEAIEVCWDFLGLNIRIAKL